MHVHIQLLQYNLLFVMYNNSLASRITRSLTNYTRIGHDEAGTHCTLSPEPATTIAELRQRVQDFWDSLSQDDIRHLCDHLNVIIPTCVAASGLHCVLMLLFGHPLLWRVCFIWSEFVIYSYNDKLLSHQFPIQRTCPFKVLHFFWQCIGPTITY